MSNLFPDGNNKDLFHAIINYLDTLQNNNKLDDDQRDSLSASVDCLKSVLNIEDVPESSISLLNLYREHTNSNNSKEPQLSKEEFQKRRDKFLKFIRVLNTKNFFKGHKLQSTEFQKLLKQARQKYNSRFTNVQVPEISELNIKESDLEPPQETNTNNINNNNNRNTENLNDIDTTREITNEDKEEAQKLKNEGNQLLKKGDYNGALKKYTEAIKKDYNNAVYYCNRAAALTYLKKYKLAIEDANRAIEIDSNYVKAYIRLGVAQNELQNYEKARDAYKEAVDRTKPTDKLWENYMQRLKKVEQKLETSNNNNNNNNVNTNDNTTPNTGMPNLGNLGNMFGGQGGGGGLGDLLKSPFAQNMMQQMMQNPDMMNNLSNMMQNPDMMNNLSSMMNDPNAQENIKNMMNNNEGGMQDLVQDFMKNPDKAKRVLKKAMQDDEVIQLRKQDNEVNDLCQKLENGDVSAMMSMTSKPELMKLVKKLMLKYGKDEE